MLITVVQEVIQSIVTGSDSSRYFGCSELSLVWWALRSQGVQRYACDFRYGLNVYLPTSGSYLLLWCHLSHWALLTACDTPPDGLLWPKHFAEPTAHSKGLRGRSDSCNYTTHSVNHSWENTELPPSCCSQVIPTQCLTSNVQVCTHHAVIACFPSG